jgi:hypothetical protein
VWLSLYAEDRKGRRELAARITDGGGCPSCSGGRLRVTRMDMPHDGYGGLFDPATSVCVADLLVAVCDTCGEAEARADWVARKPA